MGTTIALILAICLPLGGTAFLLFQIHRKSIKDWQHYVCFTVLTIFVSVLLLGVSGNLRSFGYGEAKVEFVDKKVEEAKHILEEIRKLAMTTAELSVIATQPEPVNHLVSDPLDYNGLIAHYSNATHKIEELFRHAGVIESEIQKKVEPLTEQIRYYKNERAKEANPKPN